MFFLNKKSVKGYHWKLKEYDENRISTIQQKCNLENTVAKLLSTKKEILDKDGSINFNKIKTFLNPTIRELIGEPWKLKDMEKGVDILCNSILNKEKIMVYGDYDVDGITSTALMKQYFSLIGIDISIYIPHRISEGYSLNITSVEKIKKEKINLLITVDCGITNVHECKEIKKEGIKIVITDHHIGNEIMPDVDAVINPNRFDEKNDYKQLAGVGVAFLVLSVLNKKLRDVGYFVKNNIKEPDLINFLDLVALGTTCDIVQLVGLNRAFVLKGLEIIRKRKNVGLSALLYKSNIDEDINIYHLGYVLGPKLNSNGRIVETIEKEYDENLMLLPVKLLCESDTFEVSMMINKLEAYNIERQRIEKEIIKDIDYNILDKEEILFLYGKNFKEGIIGIIASRLKDKYDKPAFVGQLAEHHIDNANENVYKFSCRSVGGINIKYIIDEAIKSGIVEGGGGHPMAGGFLIKETNIDKMKEFLKESLSKKISVYTDTKEKGVDLILECKSLTLDLVNKIEKLGPFGSGNERPKILLKNVIILKRDMVGKDKDCLRLFVADNDHVGNKKTISCICFKVLEDSEIKQAVFSNEYDTINLLGDVSINKFQKKEQVQFIIDDILLN
jgi:single-stranded-DNA-specific exonuclease